MKINLFQ